LGDRKGIWPIKNMAGIMEVGTGWYGWSGAQPDGQCACLCLSPLAPQSAEVLFWHWLTQVVPEKRHIRAQQWLR